MRLITPLHKSKVIAEKHTIFQYVIGDKEQRHISDPISSVCYKKNLYETPNSEGEFIYPNWLEKVFGELEIMFSKYRHKLERKAFHERNFKILHFLDQDERVFWITYIGLQILRLPHFLKEAQVELQQIIDEPISDLDAHNFVRRYCIPLFGEAKPDSDELFVFKSIVEPMFDMNMAVGVDLEGWLITSDKTVCIYKKDSSNDEYDEVIFPITSRICLVLHSNDNNEYRNNVLFRIDDDTRDYINGNIASAAFKTVYSNHYLTKNERKLIKAAREKCL